MRERSQVHRVSGAELDQRHRQDPHPRIPDPLQQTRLVRPALRRHRHQLDLDAALPLRQPGIDVGWKLTVGYQHDVAGDQRQRAGGEIDPIARVGSECDLAGIGMDELRRKTSGLLQQRKEVPLLHPVRRRAQFRVLLHRPAGPRRQRPYARRVEIDRFRCPGKLLGEE